MLNECVICSEYLLFIILKISKNEYEYIPTHLLQTYCSFMLSSQTMKYAPYKKLNKPVAMKYNMCIAHTLQQLLKSASKNIYHEYQLIKSPYHRIDRTNKVLVFHLI